MQPNTGLAGHGQPSGSWRNKAGDSDMPTQQQDKTPAGIQHPS
jgi:hypothetical protein